MKLNNFFLIALLLVFSSHSFALNVGDWDYKTIKGTLKQTPGCKSKEVAMKQASTGYRFKKYTDLLCKNIAYGWNIAEVIDAGEVACDACEGEYEGADKYRCYVKNITVKCRIVKRGW